MKKIYIIILIIALLMFGIVNAELTTVSSSVGLSVFNNTLLLQTPSGTTTYSIINDLTNKTVSNNFSFTKELSCPSEILNQNLINYTANIVSVCQGIQEEKRNCEAVYKTNTELSFELLGLRGVNESYVQLQSEYDSIKRASDTQAEKIQELKIEAEKVPQLERDKYTWALVALILGALGFWFFKVREKKSNPRSETDLKRNNIDSENLYPERYDKKGKNQNGNI